MSLSWIVNATPASAFIAALNSTFASLRANLSAAGSIGFATAAEPRAAAPAFAMAQCRPYIAGRDCVACFDAAAARLRTGCSAAANGGRAILDGCMLRYESSAFFNQSTLPGNTQVCNGSAMEAAGFADAARALVADLAVAVRGEGRRGTTPYARVPADAKRSNTRKYAPRRDRFAKLPKMLSAFANLLDESFL